MFFDIVFPKSNEEEYIKIAGKLDIEGVVFAYAFVDRKIIESAKKRVEQLQKTTKIKLAVMFEASGNKIYKVHDNKELAIAKGSESSRDVIARLQPDVVYDLELSRSKDFAKYRNSGLDKATCQFAAKNNTIVTFSFSNLLNSENPKLLGRMVQNIKMCKKYKVKTAVASLTTNPLEMRSPHDLKSLLLSLGMYTANAKKSLETVSELL